MATLRIKSPTGDEYEIDDDGNIKAAAKGFVESGGAGPGSRDTEGESPPIKARPVGLLEQAVKGSPGGRGYATEAEDVARGERMHAENPIEHDPIAGGVVSGLLGAGAGRLVAPVLGAMLPAGVARGAVAATEGGVASKTQGGDFATGAALGGLTQLPGVVRGAAEGARAVGEGAIERSAVRTAENPAPVKAAVKEATNDIKKHAKEVATAALFGHGVGHGTMANLYAAGRLGIPIAKAGAVAADEGIAAIARRVLGKGGAEGAAEVADNPQILQLQDALKTASPEQADMINKAIAGLRARAEATHTPRGTVPPIEAIAPTLEERAASFREVPPAAPPARAAAFGGRPPNLEATEWTPGPTDERFARQLGLSVEKYRDIMSARNARLAAARASPEAFSPDAALRDLVARAGQGDELAASKLTQLARAPIVAARIDALRRQAGGM